MVHGTVFFKVSKHRKWRDFKQLNIGILKFVVTLRRFQGILSFLKCHCKNTHIDMDIPKITACRGIILASNSTFRISDFNFFSIKRLPVASHYCHLLNVFVSLRRVQRFWLFSNCHCKNRHADMSIPKIPACRGISLASNCTFRISD